MNDRIKREMNRRSLKTQRNVRTSAVLDGDDIEPTALVYTKAGSSFIFEWDSVRCWFSALSSATV